MTTKEQIIHKSIKEVINKLSKITPLIQATPLSDICKIRIELSEMLDKYKTVEERTSKEFMSKIEDMAKREKSAFSIAKKQKDLVGLMDQEFELKQELSDLNMELFLMKRKGQ